MQINHYFHTVITCSFIADVYMHIPDGFLQPVTAVTTGVISAGVIAAALKKTRTDLDDAAVPLVGVMAAFLFVAQMVQFPVAPGVSGHLLGGALAAILFGPWIASIILTTVLFVQCFLFQDGGVLALGANILNMAVIGVFGGYWIYRAARAVAQQEKMESAAVFAASLLSVVLAAAAAGTELGLSGVFPLTSGVAVISGIHVIIGAGEAVVTVIVITFARKTCPEYFFHGRNQPV